MNVWILVMLVYSGATPTADEVPAAVVFGSTTPSLSVCEGIGRARAKQSSAETGRAVMFTCAKIDVRKP